MRLIDAILLISLLTFGAACQKDSTVVAPVFLEIVVEADPGVRLSAVPIRINGDEVGRTGPNGILRAPIFSEPGRVLRVAHDCPAGHRAPPEPSTVRMRRYDANRPLPIQIRLGCRPLDRIAAFVIKANNGSGLPVRVNGELAATTNGSGVAHFSRSGPPGSEYLVELDARDRPTLLPRSAETLVRSPDSDELFVITQSFQSNDQPKKRRPRPHKIIKIE